MRMCRCARTADSTPRRTFVWRTCGIVTRRADANGYTALVHNTREQQTRSRNTKLFGRSNANGRACTCHIIDIQLHRQVRRIMVLTIIDIVKVFVVGSAPLQFE